MSQLLSVREVAHRLNVSEGTVRRLISIGRLSAIRPCGLRSFRVTDAEVDRLLTQESTPK